MKILYIAPQHVSGTLDLWQREHRRRGDECRFVTLFPGDNRFAEDIQLNLALHPDKSWILEARNTLYRRTRGPLGNDEPLAGKPPFRKGDGPIADTFLKFRDWLNASRIEAAIEKFKLDSFDIIHFDQGMDLFRDARFARRMHAAGKRLVSFYHGSDMRNRGIFRNLDALLDLRLTCEVDLLELDDRLEYLFLPFDTDRWQPVKKKPRSTSEPVKIVHAARNIFKGTETIVSVVESLKLRYPIELTLLRNLPHSEAMRLKAEADIFIDQIADTGGWGYGMSGIEALSLGIPVCTRMRDEMVRFLPDHPFVNVTAETLETALIRLLEDESYRLQKGEQGREWVVKHHDIRSVADQLYGYYRREGWIRSDSAV